MKKVTKLFLAIGLFSIPFLLNTGQQVFAGGEPGQCPDGKDPIMAGPPIIGTVSIAEFACVDSAIPDVPFVSNVSIFRGKCFFKDVNIRKETPGDLSQITSGGDLKGIIIPQAGPPGCRSAEGGEDLIISSVKNFQKFQDLYSLVGYNYITALITMAYYVCPK